ncbi:MAG: P-loop NTPase fold protein [Roseovarius sp.]|jgi:hypothetical protein|uniref:KAP family P-loop NTPase fold protein n=1 Tax=Roseovarius sp. TaxID=1486281 RepID=UPI0032EFB803
MSGGLLTVPEPEIELYKSGFDGICKLGRAADGKKLSALVERISEPMVVALDAPWGAGKSVFLKCWVGAHTIENSGVAKTVYYDAFRHDFMDDPLIGLTAAISERMGAKDAYAKKRWQTAKEAASKLARPAVRFGLAVATYGATEAAPAIVDAAIEAGSDELKQASREFWKKEDGKRAAMQGFRDALEDLAANQKLVIVVDELDRCRPDYALNLLEVIKHFFDVPNVHFILGVNLKELANSVKARYGANVQGGKYLQKFITVSMPLVPRESRSASGQTQIRHFQRVSKEIGLHDSWKFDWLDDYLRLIDHHAGLSLRDVEKIATFAMVTPDPREQPQARLHLHVGLLIFQVLAPDAVERARTGQFTFEDMTSVFRLRQKPVGKSLAEEAHAIWWLVTNPSTSSLPVYMNQARQDFFADNEPRELLREVIAETLDVFEVRN